MFSKFKYVALGLALSMGAYTPSEATVINWNIDTSCAGATPAVISSGPQQLTGFSAPGSISNCVSPGDVLPIFGTNGSKYIVSESSFSVEFPLSTFLSFDYGASQGDLVTATAYRSNVFVATGATFFNGLSDTGFVDAIGFDRIVFRVQENGGQSSSYILVDNFHAETKFPFSPSVETPEPATYALFISGMLGMLASRRKKTRLRLKIL